MGHQISLVYAGASSPEHQIRWATEYILADLWSVSTKIATVRGVMSYNSEVYTTGNADVLAVWSPSGVFQRQWTVGSASDPHGIFEFGGEIYVSGETTDVIYVYNTSGSLQRSWSVGNKPQHLWIDSNEVYVVLFDDNKVEVYNLTGSLQRFWSTDTNPRGIMVFNNEVYVSANDDIDVYSTTGILDRSWFSASINRTASLTNNGVDIIAGTAGAAPVLATYNTFGSLVASLLIGMTTAMGVAFDYPFIYGIDSFGENVHVYRQPNSHQVFLPTA